MFQGYAGEFLECLIFQFPIYLEPVAPKLPIDQVTIDPWFQIYRELEDEGMLYIWSSRHPVTVANEGLVWDSLD